MEPKHTSGALNVAVNAALDAGKFITQSISKLDRIKVSEKRNRELVSEIDVMAEQKIIDELQQHYPEFNVIAEESGDAGTEHDCCWVIDPLDGTNNFLHGHPHCAISIALKVEQEVVAGVIFDPFRNELFSARRGAGAQLDNRRIRVADTSRLDQAMLSTSFPYRKPEDTKPWLKSFAAVLPRAQGIHRTGSSVLDFAYLAAGRYDGLWAFGLREWDIAAGALIAREAGALVSNLQGQTALFETGSLVAGTPRIHEKLLQLVQAQI